MAVVSMSQSHKTRKKGVTMLGTIGSMEFGDWLEIGRDFGSRDPLAVIRCPVMCGNGQMFHVTGFRLKPLAELSDDEFFDGATVVAADPVVGEEFDQLYAAFHCEGDVERVELFEGEYAIFMHPFCT